MQPRTDLLTGDPDGAASRSMTARIAAIVLERPLGWRWSTAIGLSALLTLLFFYVLGRVVATGVGILGIDIPVAWGFEIINYTWWSGIAMAGTVITALMVLLRAQWCTPISRLAQTITVFAIAIGGLFPMLHLGQPWFSYWLFPYPNRMALWPQWRSALVWDFVGILSYMVFSVLLWYVGLLPDLAVLRDRARQHWKQIAFGLLALGWRGDARHWQHYRATMTLLAGLALPLVFISHSVAAFDQAESLLPAWHSTLAAPDVLAGALYSGFAVVLLVTIAASASYRLHDLITDQHLDALAKAMLTAGLLVSYGYLIDWFSAFYGGNAVAQATMRSRVSGTYAPAYWSMILLNAVLPQLLWLRAVRASRTALALISIGVVVGMWLDRFVQMVSTLYRGYLPSSWGSYMPTAWDWVQLAASIGLFAFLILAFVRMLPMLPMLEMRRVHQEPESRS